MSKHKRGNCSEFAIWCGLLNNNENDKVLYKHDNSVNIIYLSQTQHLTERVNLVLFTTVEGMISIHSICLKVSLSLNTVYYFEVMISEDSYIYCHQLAESLHKMVFFSYFKLNLPQPQHMRWYKVFTISKIPSEICKPFSWCTKHCTGLRQKSVLFTADRICHVYCNFWSGYGIP